MLICAVHADLQFDYLKKEAAGGSCHAQYDLGTAYKRGAGVEQDLKLAAEWYQKAAEQNLPEAQLALGMCYAGGKGLTKSNALAVEWIRTAADQYYAPAEFTLGKSYELGALGLSKNPEKAVYWVRRAASNGSAEALYTLGGYYMEGFGVKQDTEKAVNWFLRATDKGNRAAQLLIVQNFSEWSEFIPDTNTAFEDVVRAANKGDAKAQYNLGIYYRNRSSVEQDQELAVHWLKLAGDLGNISAVKQLVEIYCEDVSKYQAEAIRLCSFLADSGEPGYEVKVAFLYAQEGPAKDLKKSAEWYVRGAKNGQLDSQIKCIFIYGKGQGIQQNRAEAYAWAHVVAKNGKPEYLRSLEPALTVEDKTKGLRCYRALMREIK